MYRISTICNLFNSLRAFFHHSLKRRCYSPLLTCYFVNLPRLIYVWSIPLYFSGNQNFVNLLHLYDSTSIYVGECEFFVLTIEKITSIYCNVSFVRQYICIGLVCLILSGVKTTYTKGEWLCLILFAWTPSSCEDKFKMNILLYVSN